MKALSLSDFSGGVSEQLASQSFETTTVSEAVGFIPDGATALRSQWALEKLIQDGSTTAIRGFSTDSHDYLVAIKSDGTVWYGVADNLRVKEGAYIFTQAGEAEVEADIDVKVFDFYRGVGEEVDSWYPSVNITSSTPLEGSMRVRVEVEDGAPRPWYDDFFYSNYWNYWTGETTDFTQAGEGWVEFELNEQNWNQGYQLQFHRGVYPASGVYGGVVEIRTTDSDWELPTAELLASRFPDAYDGDHASIDPYPGTYGVHAYGDWWFQNGVWSTDEPSWDGVNFKFKVSVVDAGVNFALQDRSFDVQVVNPDHDKMFGTKEMTFGHGLYRKFGFKDIHRFKLPDEIKEYTVAADGGVAIARELWDLE